MKTSTYGLQTGEKAFFFEIIQVSLRELIINIFLK